LDYGLHIPKWQFKKLQHLLIHPDQINSSSIYKITQHLLTIELKRKKNKNKKTSFLFEANDKQYKIGGLQASNIL
jgi:hypothetical protein